VASAEEIPVTAHVESGGTDGWGTHARTTAKVDGTFAIDADRSELEVARRSLVDLPWVWLRQMHGRTVHVVGADDLDAVRGRDGDALVTARSGVVLAVQTADCVPVTFASREGVIGVAHAGWRGLEAGVLEATTDAMRSLGATQVKAQIGPHIHASCYEFGVDELARLVRRFGPEVATRTPGGRPAFDATAAAHVALADAAVDVPARMDEALHPRRGAMVGCTACGADRWFSHRARAEPGRMATVVWRDPVDPNGTRP